jgi:cysteinyl-tRNA synthetase
MRRVFLLRGWQVHQVMNLTDVDDKIIKRAADQGTTISEVTAPIVEIFHQDREFLRIQPAEDYPKATDFIPQMVALVERLIQRGVAYKADDGSVYFAIDKFPGYGKLSRLDTREVKSGARVLQDDYTKDNAQDFALWKAASPKTRVRCRMGFTLGARASRLAPRVLGDGHGSARRDPGPPLRRNRPRLPAPRGRDRPERGGNGEAVRAHVEPRRLPLMDGAKMAKRVGNVLTVQGLREDGVSAAALRHFVFNTHYRKELNLSDEALDASVQGVRRVGDFHDRLYDPATLSLGGTAELSAAADEAVAAADAALFDDLNGPEALAALVQLHPSGERRARSAGAVIGEPSSARRTRSSASTACSTSCPNGPARTRRSRPGSRSGSVPGGTRGLRRDFAEADRIRADVDGAAA